MKRRGLSATYPARAHARPQQALLRVVQADPARLFIWCFADGDARTSNQSAARADSRTIGERIYRERRLGCRRGERGGWIGSSGRLEGSRALAARPTRRGYDVPPGSATRASDLVRRGSVPDTIAPYRLAWKGARSNGVRANSRCDAGRRASPGSARVCRARRGVGHASVRVDAGDTRETRERRRAVREGRARVWVCAYDGRFDRDETLYVRPKYLTHFTVCSRLTIHTRAAQTHKIARLSWHEDSVFASSFFQPTRLKKN